MELALASAQVAGRCDLVEPEVRAVVFMDGAQRGRLTALDIVDPALPGLCAALTVKIAERDPEILGFACRTSPYRREVSIPHGTWVAVVVTGAQGDAFLVKRTRGSPWQNIDARAAPAFAVQTAASLRACLDGSPIPSIRRHINRKTGKWNGWYVG